MRCERKGIQLHNQLAPCSNCESDVDAGCRSDALSHPFLFGLKRYPSGLKVSGMDSSAEDQAEMPIERRGSSLYDSTEGRLLDQLYKELLVLPSRINHASIGAAEIPDMYAKV